MIVKPLNDRECLDAVTAIAVGLVEQRDPAIEEIAARFTTTKELAAWIRTLPQRDDVGDPSDGPKAEACSPPQRVRIAPPDPNCVERALKYLAAAERIDPHAIRFLVTTDTAEGPHTFPVEDGQPVVLDPTVPRNTLLGGLLRNGGRSVRLKPSDAVDWIADLAHGPASCLADGHDVVERAREAMHGLLAGYALAEEDIEDVALVLALAEREARAFGPRGIEVVLTTTEALAEVDADTARNGVLDGFRIGGYRVRPHPSVVGVGRVVGRLGGGVAAAGLRGYLASQGLPPTLLDELESELNREGLTLGVFARRPTRGTIEEWAEHETKRRAA